MFWLPSLPWCSPYTSKMGIAFHFLLFQQEANQIESFIFKLWCTAFVWKVIVCLADYRLLFFFFWESFWWLQMFTLSCINFWNIHQEALR